MPLLLNGGLLPDAMRGAALPGVVGIWDFYSTFLALAGLSHDDPNPHAPAAVDGVDVWSYISGASKASPRTELAVGDVGQVGGLIISDGNGTLHKLLLGDLAQAGWTGRKRGRVAVSFARKLTALPETLVACLDEELIGCLCCSGLSEHEQPLGPEQREGELRQHQRDGLPLRDFSGRGRTPQSGPDQSRLVSRTIVVVAGLLWPAAVAGSGLWF